MEQIQIQVLEVMIGHIYIKYCELSKSKDVRN